MELKAGKVFQKAKVSREILRVERRRNPDGEVFETVHFMERRGKYETEFAATDSYSFKKWVLN